LVLLYQTLRAAHSLLINQQTLSMKKIFLIPAFFLLLLISCKKDGQDQNYYVRFSADGVSKSFTGYVFAHEEVISGYTTLAVNGATSPTSFDDYMGFYIDNFPTAAAILPGIYLDNSPDYTLLSTYNINGLEYEAGETVAENAINDGITIANHFTVNITEKTSTTIRGTFSGDFYFEADVQNGDKITITNGEFYAKFQ
jgi:hypothetical protein